MQEDTTCHLKSGLGHATTCPQGENFAVKRLQEYGGTMICTNPSCPHKQQETTGKVHVVMIGAPGDTHVITTTKG